LEKGSHIAAADLETGTVLGTEFSLAKHNFLLFLLGLLWNLYVTLSE